MKVVCLVSLGTVAAGGVVGCTSETAEGPTAITKAEASATVKSDWPADFCAQAGWYGDGVCDAWCPQPDPDCGPVDECTTDADCGHGERCAPGACDFAWCDGGDPGCCRPSTCEVVTCRQVACPLFCEHGYVPGDDGCPLCECQEPPANACGARLGETCGEDEFCDFAGDGCDWADATGTCQPSPEGCTRELRPVCGCDGQTYSNPCLAHNAGTDVAAEGACEDDPICGSFECFLECEHGFVTDANGCQTCECLPPPDTCDPVVCTLFCEHGFQVDDEGCEICECAPPPDDRTCGGQLGLGCEAGEFCDYASNGCGFADQTGTCEARPGFCPAVISPVCGCDGQTYDNGCAARHAGTDVLHDGECPAIADCRSTGCDAGRYCTFCWSSWACIPDGAVC